MLKKTNIVLDCIKLKMGRWGRKGSGNRNKLQFQPCGVHMHRPFSFGFEGWGDRGISELMKEI